MTARIVIVTGAKGGLGTFVTNKFLEAGDTVIGASRTIEASDFPASNFVATPTNFSDVNSVQKLADQCISDFKRIDVLVHVMGGFAGGAPLHETEEKTWQQMQDMNLNAAFHVVRAVIPHMRRAKQGRFVAVGSHAAVQPIANLGAYVVSKSALEMLVRTVAIENASSGITANVVLPGTMDTPANRSAMPKVDPKTWVQPADVANTIFWLASDEAGEVNGASIPVG